MNIYTANQYIKDTFGEKLYKLSLNAGTTCPNRDGTAGIGGCIFCSSLGSGDFSPKADMDIDRQIEQAKQLVASKFKGKHYIAYFQSFTNTYGDIDRLRDIYRKAAMRSDIAVISIATRPDCLGNQVIDMLRDIQRIKPVWVELGLQTIHEETAKFINRGYPISVYDEAVKKTQGSWCTCDRTYDTGTSGRDAERYDRNSRVYRKERCTGHKAAIASCP